MSGATRADLESPIYKGLIFLRQKAIDAHLGEDGLQVIHLCTVALDRIAKHGKANPDGKLTLQHVHVRWCFWLALYWLYDYWTLRSLSDAEKQLNQNGAISSDQSLLTQLLQEISKPSEPIDTDALMKLPADWLEERSNAKEDVAAFTLAVELSWYRDPRGTPWQNLIKVWRENCPKSSRLNNALGTVEARLRLQTSLTYGPQPRYVANQPKIEWQRQLAEAWALFYGCLWDELHEKLQQITHSTNTEEPTPYFALLNLVHITRIDRPAGDDQLVGLSRRHMLASRQPFQAFNEFRDSRLDRCALQLAREGSSSEASTLRDNCLRLAMLSGLSALRVWDLGAWLEARKQRSEVLLGWSLSNWKWALEAVREAVRGLNVPEPKRNSCFDEAIESVKVSPEDNRRELVRDLVGTQPAEWDGANRVLSGMALAIPEDLLPEVADWSARLVTSDLRLREPCRTGISIGFWGEILQSSHIIADALIAKLKPALIRTGQDPASWSFARKTIAASLARARDGDRKDIFAALMGTNPGDFDDDRSEILSDARTINPDFRFD